MNLAEIFTKFPILEVYVNQFTKDSLKKLTHSNSPFETNVDYMEMFEAYFMCQWVYVKMHEKFQEGFLTHQKDVEFIKTQLGLAEGLTEIKTFILSTMKSRIEATEKNDKLVLPRFLRLCRKYQFNEFETLGFAYLVICHASTKFALHDIEIKSSIKEFGAYSGMNAQQVLNFVNPHKPIIKQGIIEVDASYRDIWSESVVKITSQVLQAIMGSEISAEDFLKIDKTFLADTLTEEVDFHIDGITEKKPGSKIEKDEPEEDEVEIDDDDLEKDLNGLKIEDEKNFDLYAYIKDDQIKNTVVQKKKDEENDATLTPYTSDVDYLEDRFLLIACKMRMQNVEMEQKDEDGYKRSDRNPENILRELRAKERMLSGKCEKRLKMTLDLGKWEPRLEKLAKMRKLDDFEKMVLVLLIAGILSHEVAMVRKYDNNITVGNILATLCSTLQERILNRKIFYRNSVLVLDGFIRLSDKLSEDLMMCTVDIDRRMLDYFVGLDCEFAEIVEGSHLYFPSIKLENVIIPDKTKSLILNTVSNYESFKVHRKKLGFEDVFNYGKGIVLLFYGESGTGKTFLANALANNLGKKILVINFGTLGDKTGELLKFIFREAKINDALLFFDECESFFETRDRSFANVQPFLTEIERHDGLIILATNRAYDLDEAMHRRITLAIEFQIPDPILRESIWKKHVPQAMHDAIDFEKISLNYELTGGLIKNAVLTALSLAVARDTQNPKICEKDLETGAKLQLRGALMTHSFEKRIIPSRGINELVVSEKTKADLDEIISFEKSRRILFTQWGFSEKDNHKHATSVLIYGPSGCGKSLAIEGIAFECGAPLKIVDMLEVMTKYSFSTSQNIQNIFKETKKAGAILVFEISQSGLFKVDESIEILLTNIEHFTGIVILSITSENIFTIVDQLMLLRFKFCLELTKPNAKLRNTLWKRSIPKKCPTKDLNFEKLAEYELTGGEICDIVFKTASQCSLKKIKEIAQEDFVKSIEEYLSVKSRGAISSMFY